MTYKQLTQIQRYQIYALLKTAHSQSKIAKVIGVHRSTICRELKRNRGKRGYRPQQAQKLAVSRQKKAQPRIERSVWEQVEEKLLLDWSPEQIAGRMRKEGYSISHEWIYQYVYADKRSGGNLWKHLRCQKKRRKRINGRDQRGILPNRISIDLRPEIVEARSRLGDWEGDTIVGARHKGAILTLVDRKSGYTLLGSLPKREANQVECQATKLLQAVPHVRTLTVDNGKEFAQHSKITEQTGVEVYFSHPYSSWERGTNENTNGLVRQYLPKKRRLDDVLEVELVVIMDRLNHRPRKRLDFLTPHEVFFEVLVAVDT
jgi:IS30 family transposase